MSWEPEDASPHGRQDHRVQSTKRLALHPERKPGVAPPCEDDKAESQGDGRTHARPVSLAPVAWLNRG